MKITIDYTKCVNPLECGKCLKICPPAIFILYPLDRKEGIYPDKWKVIPTYNNQCKGCNVCVDGCPTLAVKLK